MGSLLTRSHCRFELLQHAEHVHRVAPADFFPEVLGDVFELLSQRSGRLVHVDEQVSEQRRFILQVETIARGEYFGHRWLLHSTTGCEGGGGGGDGDWFRRRGRGVPLEGEGREAGSGRVERMGAILIVQLIPTTHEFSLQFVETFVEREGIFQSLDRREL